MRREFAPGFQGSHTTGVRCRLYSQGGDPILGNPGGILELDGRANEAEDNPSVIGVTTSKGLGAASGQWSIQVRTPGSWGRSKPSLFNRVVDDDWADIVFTVNARKTHVMRGQIDNIKEETRTTNEGATSRVYTITGRDFGRILEMTPVWFNAFRAENAAGDLTLKQFNAFTIGGKPNQTVRRIVFGFLETLTGKQRANWQMPPSMQPSGTAFVDNLYFDDVDFDENPSRYSISQQFENPDGAPVWSLAQQWSDPMFCELFTDLGPQTGRYFNPEEEYDLDNTDMRLIFRNKPFPTVAKGKDSLWFSLPVTEIPASYIQARDIGVGGTQRFNSFIVSPQTVLEVGDANLLAPLWDVDDIHRHGLRNFSVESRYVADKNDLLTMSSVQRAEARDFHCLNPYLFSGSLSLGALFPSIRIGTRLRIVNERESLQENYYVEQVAHSWSVNGGGRTTLTVSRGWVGSEESYLRALEYMASRYSSIPNGKTETVVSTAQGVFPGNRLVPA